MRAVKNEQGFTLLEILVSLSVLGIATASATMAFIVQSKQNTIYESKNSAQAAAQTVLEELRQGGIAALPTTGSTSQVVQVGIRSYNVNTYYCLQNAYCAQNSSRHLKIEVERNGSLLFTTETVYTALS